MSQDKELRKAFRSDVEKLKNLLIENADNESIIVGTKDKPIVSDNPNIPIEHMFMEGVYVRKMTMFKDTVVLGAIHHHKHICFLLKGNLTVRSEEGLINYVAPCFIIAEPGNQRLLYAHEDSEWYNIHANPDNGEDTEEIESRIVSVTYEDFDEYIKNKK